MRSMFSNSYSALDSVGGGGGEFDRENEVQPNPNSGNVVYQSTTSPSIDIGFRGPEKFNMVNSVRRAFRGAANRLNIGGGGGLRSSQSVFVLPDGRDLDIPQIHSSRGDRGGGGSSAYMYKRGQNTNRKMPVTGYNQMEEAALLGAQPSEGMDEVELKNIQLSFPSARTLSRGEGLAVEERVDTNFGSVLVGIQGDRSKPAILTYHDLGLNYVSNYQAFFNFVDMRLLLQNFCVYHMNAPGQEEGAHSLPDTFVYPTMDELGEQINDVMIHFGLKRIIGFGVGAGANILCRFALGNPEKMDALCVLNCLSTAAGWIEWGYQKLNTRNLKSKGMTQSVVDYLMWHHFGKVSEERNHDLVYVYQQYFENQVNPTNLSMFIDSYIRRTDLAIVRDMNPQTKGASRTLKMSVLNVTGDYSPHVDDTVTFNGRLDPSNSTWLKFQDCGMVMEEQPAKLSEAFRLFLQGQGYVPCLNKKRVSAFRRSSVDSGAGISSGSGSSRSSVNNLNGKVTEISDIVSKSEGLGSGVSTPRDDGISLITLSSPTTELPGGGGIEMKALEKGMGGVQLTENPVC